MIKKGTRVRVRQEGVRPYKAVVVAVEEDLRSQMAKRKVWIREKGSKEAAWVLPEEVSVEGA